MGLNPSLFCLQGTNTYLIGLGNRKILVDVSDENPDYVVLLQKSLKSISPDAYISDILISHCHHDHWRSLPSIMKSSQNDPPIRVHKYPLPPNSEDITSHMDDFPRDIPLQDLYDRQVFHIDQGNDKTTTLHVIYTPGHADDHCSFWLEEEKTLLAGDCVIGHGTTLVNDVKDYVT
ncbi:beta-lactamase-like protein, partial [Chlamydoabsidia padenii]